MFIKLISKIRTTLLFFGEQKSNIYISLEIYECDAFGCNRFVCFFFTCTYNNDKVNQLCIRQNACTCFGLRYKKFTFQFVKKKETTAALSCLHLPIRQLPTTISATIGSFLSMKLQEIGFACTTNEIKTVQCTVSSHHNSFTICIETHGDWVAKMLPFSPFVTLFWVKVMKHQKRAGVSLDR